MQNEITNVPDYLFEVSWEVCNKVGGIHTVISTKAITLSKVLKNNHIFIGPDILRHTSEHPEFIEDKQMLKSWRERSASEGLRIKVGRWNIIGNPIAVLVDFSTFISQKDEIFKIFWEKYKLDSLAGQWDYIEPALFGYAAGKVIESYTRFYLSRGHKIVAHFHEWMTGTGLLYLDYALPQVATVFTTHATVLGRSIAGNGYPLYDNIEKYNPDIKALEFNVVSKQSLEKLSAANADCFTTVSDITSKECAAFLSKKVDMVTPNGFENSFVPIGDEFKLERVEARIKFYEVAEALLTCEVPKDSIFIGMGGRYEFKNKGIDVFIEALGILNKDEKLKKNILAFIMVPAGHHGPRKDVFHNLMDKDSENIIVLSNKHITHYLLDPDYDPILKRAKELGINNNETDKVKLFFVPCYLDGNDGIINKTYYQMLIGLDLTVFPSYYEPWGYTPLESLAFEVPTITTSLAGFGLWVKNNYKDIHPGIGIIERTDTNDVFVIENLSKQIKSFTEIDTQQRDGIKQNAVDVSKIALWENLISYYYKAFHIALSKVDERIDKLLDQDRQEQLPYIEQIVAVNKPTWIRLMIQKNIPKKLEALDQISRNYWWCWNHDAIQLFESIDPALWKESGYNAFLFLEKISFRKYQELEKDDNFLNNLNSVYEHFQHYISKKEKQTGPRVAYFSMEFGIHSSLKIYSGGLGILAGDYLKEASDKNTDITGIGLLYRYGYFSQQISSTGMQIAEYEPQDFSKIPAIPVRDDNGNWLTITVVFPGRNLYARIWKIQIGRNNLYLLDTDFEDNLPEDRSITHHLYGGNLENRLKQELLLGVGGIRALKALGINPDVFHCNEGHAAFIGIERINSLIKNEKLSFTESLEVVRSTSLFTTHTPVPAGHDAFPENLLRTYIAHYPDRLKISWDQFIDLGKINFNNPNEKFSMSFLAANMSQEVNGVSMLHGKVSRDIFKNLWPGYFPDELHIGYVTNGVHFPTWASAGWEILCHMEPGKEFADHEYTKDCWDKVYDVADSKIWELRQQQKKNLINFLRTRLLEPETMKYDNPKQIIEIRENLRENVLTIGFARRFATYKRAYLLFRNIERLSKIVNNPDKPIQFIFAGKAHPNDTAGQEMIKRIVEVSKQPEFIGKVIFLQNYDMELARNMVQGVDIWLNNPTRPMEASGTSGMKAVMNGVLHFSVLDGWWVEGYSPDAGWALPEEQTYGNNDYQDELDAETIYNIIENEIVPAYYQRNKSGLPEKWVGFIKNSIAKVASNFTTHRMLTEYENKFYYKLAERGKKMMADDFQMAKDIAAWKKKVSRCWESLEILSIKQFDVSKEPIVIGKKYSATVEIKLNGLSPDDIGVELVVAEPVDSERVSIKHTQDFEIMNIENSLVTYSLDITPTEPGVFDAGIRVYAKNPNLPHRQDFCLVKWL
ncbi:MAG: alpha-glucan phosphorylase [Bacteroidetes bacterium GWC2_33_15]|nr:MAG: alpha-glucan phosphorylase [Bacteroidetes bacterium GWA2_33_15]OFX51167.1 MAG: alpha-glucan phosphorylase [Bacteroidetes bacterium GWC2_33_15]OFX66400.1 MAG: alpha-glucan phosphorylase [Bacteroidetes bacterium GWB2_32_14]OFX70375.1 MAG: alpha-glucan phosphorylase [Bacteroidetes bacterium GWD2_33_33]HAN17381.1 alpha-glucan family phosphorylase [Bacteroidales bacterium]